MPFFITHTTYLDKFWREQNYPQDFFSYGVLGTTLPDIRYMFKFPREESHFFPVTENLTFCELYQKLIRDLDSLNFNTDFTPEELKYFKIGFAFHLVLDYWWPRQIHFPSDFKYIGMCLKLIDEIVRWDDYKLFKIKSTLSEFSFLNLEKEKVKQWYEFVFKFMEKQPSPVSIRESFLKNDLAGEKIVFALEAEIKKNEKNKAITERLDTMFRDFSWKKIADQKINES